MTPSNTISIARWAAHRVHAHRAWLELDDLEQEAVRAVLEAATRYDPARGEWRSYACTMALYHLTRYASDVSSPVSGSYHLRKSADIRRDEWIDVIEQLRDDRARGAYRAVADREVRDRIVELVGREHAELAYRAFAHEERPREIARADGFTAQSVSNKLQKIRARVRRDAVLLEMREP